MTPESIIVDQLTDELMRELVRLLRPALPWGRQHVVGTLPGAGPVVLRIVGPSWRIVSLERN